MNAVGKLAKDVRDLYTVHGWIWVKGYFGNEPEKRACLVGATRYILTGSVTGIPKGSTVLEFYAQVGTPVTAWNDEFGRTYEDVINKLNEIVEKNS